MSLPELSAVIKVKLNIQFTAQVVQNSNNEAHTSNSNVTYYASSHANHPELAPLSRQSWIYCEARFCDALSYSPRESGNLLESPLLQIIVAHAVHCTDESHPCVCLLSGLFNSSRLTLRLAGVVWFPLVLFYLRRDSKLSLHIAQSFSSTTYQPRLL